MELIELGLENDSLHPHLPLSGTTRQRLWEASRWADGKDSTAQCQHRTQQCERLRGALRPFHKCRAQELTCTQAPWGSGSQPALHPGLGSGPRPSSAVCPLLSAPSGLAQLPIRAARHEGRLGLCGTVWVANPGHFPTPVGIQEGYFDQFSFFFFFVKWQSITLSLKEGEGHSIKLPI